MKSHTVATLILSLAGLTGLANAQSGSIIADVPFNYIVNGKAMPAGECRVRVEGDGMPYLWIAAEKRSAFAMPILNDASKPADDATYASHSARHLQTNPARYKV